MIKIANSLESFRHDTHCNDILNVFFGENYSSFVCDGSCSSSVYVYSEKYVMPVSICKKFMFCWGRFLSEPYIYSEGNDSLKAFLNNTCQFLKKAYGIQWIEITPAYTFFNEYPEGAKHVPFGSHVINLTLDEEILFNNIHSKHRNVIKKAEKEGVVIEKGVSDKLISDYYKIDILTWKRSNRTASGEGTLHKIVNKLKENIIIYIAYKDGEPQSGAVFFYNNAMCYYMHGANNDNPVTGSGNLLQWQAIKDMKAYGVAKFSFVGCRINEDKNSKYHGIQRFKERFGGELVQGFLFKKVLSKFYFNLFIFSKTCISLLKHGRIVNTKDIIDEEIYKWEQ